MFSKLKKLLKSGKDLSHDIKGKALDNPEPCTGTRIPTGEAQTKQTPSKPLNKKSKPRYNKQGILVFEKDQDVGQLFPVEDGEVEDNQSTPIKEALPPKKEKKSKPRLNKHGFPVLDSCSDIGSLMMGHHGRQEDTAVKNNKRVTTGKHKKKIIKDKHGIPILDHGDSVFASGDTLEQDDMFPDLLLESLGNKSFDVLLQEKKDEIKKRKKISLKQKLKAYPLPQSQLDLHGYTALKAQLRTESYLKNAFLSQTHTVIIIVGKGLHSDEGAVLPDVVESRLIHLKKEKLVLAYEWDNKTKSRSGAVIVYLNNMSFD